MWSELSHHLRGLVQTDMSDMANDIAISDTDRVEFITFFNPRTGIDVATTSSSRTPSEQAREPGPHRFWISASELCRGFGKKFRDFLASERGRELLKAFLAIPFEQGGMPGPEDHSHIFRRGKTGFGNDAWICPRLVPHVVYWLSPELSIRLNHVMVEVLLGHQSSADGRAAIEQVRLTRLIPLYHACSLMYYLPYFAWYLTFCFKNTFALLPSNLVFISIAVFLSGVQAFSATGGLGRGPCSRGSAIGSEHTAHKHCR